MAEFISKINLGGTVYNIKDASLAPAIQGLIDDASADFNTLGKIQKQIENNVADVRGTAAIDVTESDGAKIVAIRKSAAEGNIVEIKNDGLYVGAPDVAEYSVVRSTEDGDYAAVYHLTKDGVEVGDAINIPKDYLVKSGSVVKGTWTGDVFTPGEGDDKAIEFVINAKEGEGTEEKIYINVKDLVDVYTAGDGIEISETNEVSAKVADETENAVDAIATGKNFLKINDSSALEVRGVDADSTITTEDITVAGGPLASMTTNWPWKDTAGNNIVPGDKSIQEILTGLFLKEVDGTISIAYSPTKSAYKPTISAPNASLAKSGAVEVGETTTFEASTKSGISSASVNAKLTANQGYFVGDSNTWNGAASSKTVQTVNGVADETGLEITSIKWNGVDVSAGSELTIIEGTNTLEVKQHGTTVSIDPFIAETYYASKNTKKKLLDTSVAVADQGYASPYTPAEASTKKTVTGARAYWYGFTNAAIDPEDLTNEYFRAITAAPSTSANAVGKTLTAPATGLPIQAQSGFLGLVITVPADKTITSIKKEGAPTDLISIMNTKTVSIEGANGFAAKSYKVYYTSWAEGGDKSTWTLAIK